MATLTGWELLKSLVALFLECCTRRSQGPRGQGWPNQFYKRINLPEVSTQNSLGLGSGVRLPEFLGELLKFRCPDKRGNSGVLNILLFYIIYIMRSMTEKSETFSHVSV
jgi:hypothetical protein